MMTSIRPPSTLLIGPAGTGKTSAIATLLKAGISVGMLATEHTAPRRVLDACRTWDIDDRNFHWKYVSPAQPKWSSLIEAAAKVKTMTLKQLSDLQGLERNAQWIEVLETCNRFISDRDEKDLGDISNWADDAAFVIDGLTGINEMSRNLTVGLKPTPSPGEWGVMQGNILNFIAKLCADCHCFFVCIAHIEREQDEITGIQKLTVSTLGSKLAPKLPPKFTTVVEARRSGTKFSWSTASTAVDTKNGDLAFSDDLPPDFSPLVQKFYEQKKALSSPSPVTPAVGGITLVKV